MTGSERPTLTAKARTKRPVPFLLGYLALVFVGGALVAPWLYFGAQAAAAHSDAWQWVARNPFHRFVHRSMLILAIVGIWPLCKATGITWSELGLKYNRREKRRVWAGFFVGLVSLSVVGVISLLFGGRAFYPPENPVRAFVIILLTAAGVGLIEELIFRGALFGCLRSPSQWKGALVISSAIYAIVHFFSRPVAPPEITWLSGFVILEQMLRGFVDMQMLIPGFVNLTLVGLILGMAYQLSGTISFSIGLHVGWIFCGQTYVVITRSIPRANQWLWGTDKLIDGWSSTIVLVVTLAGLSYWFRRSARGA